MNFSRIKGYEEMNYLPWKRKLAMYASLILQLHILFFKIKIFLERNVSIISGSADLIDGFRRAIMLLVNGTILFIPNALHSARSKRNLLSFKYISINEYHIEFLNKNNIKYPHITKNATEREYTLEKHPSFSFGLYYTIIN